MKTSSMTLAALALALPMSAAMLAAPAARAAGKKDLAQIKRGEHLVKVGLCADCHTPKKMGPTSPPHSRTMACAFR